VGKAHYLVISDLHLGEDVGSSFRTTESLEEALVSFLDHHRTHGGPWRLVINGDMLEMVGVVMLPHEVPEPLDEALHPHDRRYGVGGRQQSATVKMRAMIAHHAVVFRALGRFVGAGHQLAIVIGNHDIELHWPSVQAAFTEGVVQGFLFDVPEGDAEAVRDRVCFYDWFLYDPGVVWIEHGNQYDPYCSFRHPLAPAIDAVEVDPNIGGLLMRYVGSQFGDEVHEIVHKGTAAYLRLWVSRGPRQMYGLLLAYFDMCRRLFEHRAVERAGREAHARQVEERVEALAASSGLGRDTLEQLCALWEPPVADRFGRLFRGLMVDRVTLLITIPPAFMLLLLAPASMRSSLALTLAPLVVVLALLSMMRRDPSDPRPAMSQQAAAVRAILDVPYVVMGHSHDPVHEIGEDGGAYLNTGTWAPRGDPRKTFTHVRIEHTPDGAVAALRQWRHGASHAFDPENVSLVAADRLVEGAAV